MAPVLPMLVPEPVGIGTGSDQARSDGAFNQLASLQYPTQLPKSSSSRTSILSTESDGRVEIHSGSQLMAGWTY